MELNAKHPELGLIPYGWEVRTLGSIGTLEMGKGLLKGEIQPVGDIPAIPYTSLYTDFSEIINLKNSKWYVSRESAPCVVTVPCVLLASSSNVAANTGKACALTEASQVAVGREVIVLKTRQCVAYISYLLSQRPYRQRTLELAKGTTIKHVYPTTFENYAIALPEEQEQRAIATALSDVDALIAGLERLIAKKRDIKQAAMQQLLTGQTRLPGFSGEWVSHRLGDNVQFLKNGVNARAELTETGYVKYLHYGDIHGSAAVFLNADQAAMPHLPPSKAANLDRLQDGDLVFADASENKDGIGKAVELRGIGQLNVVSGLHTIAARFDKKVLADGFKAYLQFMPPFSLHLKRLAAGTKVYATNRGHIASVELKLPSCAEQTAIATILSDMDTDLSALEARLAKTRALKQGMMQELLTGRTRLV